MKLSSRGTERILIIQVNFKAELHFVISLAAFSTLLVPDLQSVARWLAWPNFGLEKTTQSSSWSEVKGLLDGFMGAKPMVSVLPLPRFP